MRIYSQVVQRLMDMQGTSPEPVTHTFIEDNWSCWCVLSSAGPNKMQVEKGSVITVKSCPRYQTPEKRLLQGGRVATPPTAANHRRTKDRAPPPADHKAGLNRGWRSGYRNASMWRINCRSVVFHVTWRETQRCFLPACQSHTERNDAASYRDPIITVNHASLPRFGSSLTCPKCHSKAAANQVTHSANMLLTLESESEAVAPQEQ